MAALHDLGYSTVPEAARAFLREQLDGDGGILPSTDDVAFMKEVLARSVRDHEAAGSLKAPAFFDRGIPEWLRFMGSAAKAVDKTTTARRYADTVFVAGPWPEIYVCDRERQASFDVAARSFEATVSAYVEAGYEICVIPKATVQECAAFVLARIGACARTDRG